jgi:DNA mismatch repair protein MutL
MRIRRLPEGTINRIAAGEVVERPASVVKELVENAIDAEATRVEIIFRGGGRQLIKVSDDGLGMEAEDLALAVERHATSKLLDDDLIHIRSFGFRGEALPSIGAVARLSIVSRTRSSEGAFEIEVEGGQVRPVRPAALGAGTEVEVRDLFFATPARLKFLKSERGETAEAVDAVRRMALAHPAIGFTFVSEERRLIDVAGDGTLDARIRRILGAEFIENALPFASEREGIAVRGYAGLPTWSRAQSNLQYTYVNGRPVRDKLLSGAIRGAYTDLMSRSRYPAVVLFVTCPADRVDVNVHPAKSEVRFRDGGVVRSLVVNAIRNCLAAGGQMPDRSLSQQASQRMGAQSNQPFHPPPQSGMSESQHAFEMDLPPEVAAASDTSNSGVIDHPLGAARAQVHENYIIAQTADGLILVDQHAAHERLVYERMKREQRNTGIASQPLLVPQVIDLDPASVERLAEAGGLLSEAGLYLESFGESAVIVREVPSALNGGDIVGLVRDVADELGHGDQTTVVEERLNHILATMACHHSVRSGRILRQEEMNALLREMEATPNSGQCNHGRPTFIELKLDDIERLFGRR